MSQSSLKISELPKENVNGKKKPTVLAYNKHGFYSKIIFVCKHTYVPACTQTQPINNMFLLDSLLYPI